MPVLRHHPRALRQGEAAASGQRLGACLHITCETANLLRTLKAGRRRGARAAPPIRSRPRTTSPPRWSRNTASPAYAIHGEDRDTYYSHLRAVLETPSDDHDGRRRRPGQPAAHRVRTTRPPRCGPAWKRPPPASSACARWSRTARSSIPVVAVNDAQTKHLFDNRYGTGQSTLDGIIRATGVLVAGSVVVVAGYGWCGRGVASRARGLGANVIVTEVNPIRALEAAMDGYQVMRMARRRASATSSSPSPATRTIIGASHLSAMKDGAIICNSGHFDVEIDLPALRKLARRVDRQADARGRRLPSAQRPQALPARPGTAGESRVRRGPSRAGDGHELRHPGDGGGVGRRERSSKSKCTTCRSRSKTKSRA